MRKDVGNTKDIINDGLTKSQRYRLRHREKCDKAIQKWRNANPQKNRECCRKYYQKNHINELRRAKVKFQVFKANGYSEKRRLSQRVNCHLRRMAMVCENPLTKEEWQQILKETGGLCIWCGSKDVTIDHIMPVSKGGEHTKDNIQVLCRRCNSSKGVKCG